MVKNKRETAIREYEEEMEVTIGDWQKTEMGKLEPTGEKRLVIVALNEGGYNGTSVDLTDVIEWVKANKPELLQSKEFVDPWESEPPLGATFHG